MEIARPQIDLEKRFRSVKLSSLKSPIELAFNIQVAGVLVRIAFDSAWDQEVPSLCKAYWSSFVCERPGHQVEIILSPADGEYIQQKNALWNEPQPFQERIDDPTGTWIFHRDFTCLVRGTSYHAWLPRPTPIFTDALDNILSVSVRHEAEKRAAFLFHSAIVEHEGKAVVLFGPSGIGKSTVAKLSRENGLRVMASDQAYLRVETGPAGDRLLASASPTRNPDIPRTTADWVTGSLEVKALFALKRTGAFELLPMDRAEMTRRFFSEIFRDETDTDFTPALKFACDAIMLRGVRQASLSYPFGFNFWPRAKELGYI
jgi:hypothetical protein